MRVEWKPSTPEAVEEADPPKPAKLYMPDWYKKLPPFESGNKPQFNSDSFQANSTEKLCMPFFDTFVTGYIQETWADIIVEPNGSGGVNVSHANPRLKILGERENSPFKSYPDGFSNRHYYWFTQWEPKTPKGWSTLYMHPMNHFDLPFLTINGVMDTDRWWIGGGLPFYLREGFEGIIPKGTPMYQMVFFKRENWTSKVREYNDVEHRSLDKKVRSHLHSGFKKNIWVKKNYD